MSIRGMRIPAFLLADHTARLLSGAALAVAVLAFGVALIRRAA